MIGKTLIHKTKKKNKNIHSAVLQMLSGEVEKTFQFVLNKAFDFCSKALDIKNSLGNIYIHV